jgi:glycosyltransferase involved in cell wall biosynthesis
MRHAVSDLPRLLLCCFDVIPAPTAISRRVTEYLKGLSERYQVVVLTVKTPDHTHIERYQGARLLRVPVGSGDLAARVQAFDRAVRRQLDSEEYVMVHFFDPFGGYALCERRSEFGYKLVYDACSLPSVDLPFLVSEEEANRRFIAKVRRQELYCLMNADVVIVANELTRDFVASLGVTREQVQVLPAPVDLGPYDPKVMGLPDATPMKLLHLGNQSSAQDLSTLLEAMQLALQTVDVRLTILGPKDEEHQARLEEQVAALKLSGKVDFQPQVAHDDLHKVLAAADVGLLTLSDVERNSRVGSPLSRLGEYLAAGRPVIAADVAAARALLPDDGVVLYRPQDKHSLADAIVSLATEPNRRVKLGAAARAASLERDAAKIRADLVAIYVALSGTGVRAVGDADTTTPDEVTQLGRSLDSEDTQRRKAGKAAQDPPSGTNKVKTDPAIAAEDTSPEAGTGLDRPSVMGVPIRDEEPPVVLGHEAQEMAAEFAQVSTEPNARRQTEPPVVMGLPLNEPVRNNPEAPTPGDLAAELGEIEGPSGGLDAPTSAIPDEPRHLDDAPTTGSHLSLVPPVPAISPDADEPLPGVPSRETAPLPPVTAPEPPPAPEPLAFEPAPRAAPAEEPPIVIPPLEFPPLSSPAITAPVPAAKAPQPAPPPRENGMVALLTVPPLPPRSSASGVHAPLAPPPRTSSGVFSAMTPTAPLAPPGRTTSGVFSAMTPTAPLAPPPRTTSGLFSAMAPTTPPPARTASGIFTATTPSAAPRTTSGVFSAMTPPALPPRSTSGIFAVTPAPHPHQKADKPTGLFPEPPSVPGPEEISESEIEEITDGEGPEEVGADEIEEVAGDDEAAAASQGDESLAMASEESVMTVDTDPSPPPSAIDPWLAQLVHGYCPPESGLFERHTPPTTMPGRDT